MLRTRSSFSYLFSAAVAVLAMTSTITIRVTKAIANTYRAAADWVTKRFLDAVSLAQSPAGEVAKTPERMVRVAEQYQATQDKRQRPRIENSWRMCPST